jgi:tetratricopeptide (TPR) repeat protein
MAKDSRPRGASGDERAARGARVRASRNESIGLGSSGAAFEPDGTGMAEVESFDGFHQPTAMFDKGELLGELAELESEPIPGTRVGVEAEEGPKGCRLIVVAGPDLGVEWAFKQAEIVIGRAPENDIDFADIAVSREHARISREGAGFVLEDLRSDNGTLLNGVRIDREPLSSGDEIIIGARTLRFVELNEAPPTAAKHPIIDAPGRLSAIVPAELGPLASPSQVKVSVVEKAEPSARASATAPATPKKPRSKAAILVVVAIGALAVLVGLGVLAFEIYLRVTHQSPEEKALRARTAFLTGVELVKLRRFGDASWAFDASLVDRPEYVRAKEYRAHAEKEIAVWRELEAANALIDERRYDEALVRLEPLLKETESAWAPEIASAVRAAEKAIAEAKVEEARRLAEQGELELARDLLEEALTDFPGLASALALQARLQPAGDDTPEPERPKGPAKPRTPPEMERAVALYREDKIPQAIDAADAAGGPNALKYVERFRKMQAMLEDIVGAHRQKAAAELIRLAPKALELDQSIAHGDGEIRGRLKDYYADALYLKGLEALQDEEYARAYAMLVQALRVRPGHKLSETRLAELTLRARELYYQGNALADANVEETRRIFKQVTAMTKPDNQYHQWARRWLSAHGGG